MAASSLQRGASIATVTSSLPIRNGAIFEIGGGYRIRPRFAVAVAFSSFSRSSVGALAASVPDPIFYGQSTVTTAQTSALDHAERAVHIEAVWSTPLTHKIDLALSAGPSFIRVTQQVETMSVPTGAQSAVVSKDTAAGTAFGANVGVESHYMFAPRFGVGLFVRYAAGSVDLPSISKLTVGGFRTGLGFRVAF